MPEVIQIINLETGRVIPKGHFSEITVEQCKREPSVFKFVYDDSPTEEKPTTYNKNELAAFSMKDLREIYDMLAEGRENPPSPTTSKDGIIKAITELQGR